MTSYQDYTTTMFGDINEDGNVDILMKELTTEKGFKPIDSFAGSFDGQGHEIRNLYEKNRDETSLFGCINGNSSVRNLGLTGNLEGIGNVGGFASRVNGQSATTELIIENCYFKGDIKAGKSAGGIIGTGVARNINNCFSIGNIKAEENAGGIIGFTASEAIVVNCYNMSNVYGVEAAGGILGWTNYNPKIYNCFNVGNIKLDVRAGGIMGYVYAATSIKNVYNIGKVECSNESGLGGIVGTALWNNPDTLIENSFYLEGTATKGTNKVTDTTIVYSIEMMKSEKFISELNEYIDNNADTTEGWFKWKTGENGYPVFE